jgi:Tfp pilus assembly protein PilF
VTSNRTVRIFLSSTFRDFGEERDLLVRRVFPALRAKLRERFVELVDVDLRWGITVEQAERGEVLPICLAEIDRARPYFIGMLGERYGWVPPAQGFAVDLLERQPWLKKHQGGKSVTELEILHGVLNNRKMKGRAFFYFRAPGYARARGGEYVPATPEDRQRQADLKRRIRDSAYPAVAYRDPQALARRMERDLWKLLDADFPAASVPDAFARDAMRHEAYAAPRRRLYLGGERYQEAMERALASGTQRIVIEGDSGAGKSALLANFFERWGKRHPRDLVHTHYLGASLDAADPHALVRRLIERIQRTTHSRETLAADPQELMDSLPQWLGTASAWARKHRTRVLLVLDSLNSLTSQQDLRWWPAFVPQGVTLVVSCLPGAVLQALGGQAQPLPGRLRAPAWTRLRVKPLTRAQRHELLTVYLGRYNKSLSPALMARVMAHPLAGNPLFLRTLSEELRLFGVHEQLAHRLAHYLESQTVDDLFERVLARVEGDCGSEAVRVTMTSLWASRAGLSDKEILGIARLQPADWAAIRHALDEALLDTGGRIGFAHDYLGIAVRDRYLPRPGLQAAAHARLGRWFQALPLDERRAHEEPWQWLKAQRWRELRKWLDDAQVITWMTSNGQRAQWLAYWLEVGRGRPVDLSSHYRRVWARWAPDLAPAQTLTRATALQQALEFAGYQGHFEERLARHALDASTRLRGPRHAATLECTRHLAQLMAQRQQAHDCAQAATLLRDVVSAERQARSPELATTLNLLGTVLTSLKNFEAARETYEEALACFEAADGQEDPESTATVLNNLGDLAVSCANPQEAQRWLERCLQIRRRSLPPDHPLLATTLDNLGKALTARNKGREATAHFERALAIRTSVLGSDHPETNNTRVNWGTLLTQEGQYREAGTLFRAAWEADVRRFGASHWYAVMDAVTCLACARKEAAALGAQGQRLRAKQALERAQEIAVALASGAARSQEDARQTAIRALGLISAQAQDLKASSLAHEFSALAAGLKAVAPTAPPPAASPA